MKFILLVVAGLMLTPPSWAGPAPTTPGKNWTGTHSAVIQLIQKRNYKGAVKAAEALVAQNAKDHEAHYLLGRASFHLKRDLSAMTHLSRAIELAPDYPNPYFFRAMTQAYAKKSKAAAKDFEKAATLAPKEPIYWVELARNYGRMGNAKAAVSGMEKAVALNPKRPQGWYLLGNYRLKAGDPVNARTAWDKTVALKPNHVRAHFSLGQYHQTAGHPDKAAIHFAAVLAKKPNDVTALEKMIQVHNQQGLHAKAETFRSRYLQRRQPWAHQDNRRPHRFPRPPSEFCIDQFGLKAGDVFVYEIENKSANPALHLTFRLTRNGAPIQTVTLETHPSPDAKKKPLALIMREATAGRVGPGMAAGRNGSLKGPPPPREPGTTIKIYDKMPPYSTLRQDVMAAFREKHSK